MKKHLSRRRQSTSRRGNTRRPQIESLEQRLALSVTFPTITGVTNGAISLPAGAPLMLPLQATDSSSSATITYTATVSNDATGKVTATVMKASSSTANPFIDIAVQNYGDIKIELFQNLTPKTVARIEQLIQNGFYNTSSTQSMTFHRVIPNFMIQGGDPLGTGHGGSGVQFNDEFSPDLKQTTPGLLCMANSGADTDDSQFFITTDTTSLYGSGDSQYTIFGKVVQGQSIVDQISNVARDANNKPTTAVVISSISIITDKMDGVLELAVPAGNTNGSATITVTASDGTNSVDQHFTANFAAYTYDPPTSYLDPIAQPATYNGTTVNNAIYTTVNTPVQFNLAGRNLNNTNGLTPVTFQYDGTSGEYSADVPYSAGSVNANLDVVVNPTTGAVTITPKNGIVGRFEASFRVQGSPTPPAVTQNGVSPWYTLTVPVYIAPTTPTGIGLAASSSTGTNATNLNNVGTSKELSFDLTGLTPGTKVTLMADGKAISTAQDVTGATMTIKTNGAAGLTNGTHSITAVESIAYQAGVLVNRQVAAGSLTATSSALSISVTASPAFQYVKPTFNSTPVTQAFINEAFSYTASVTPVTGQTVTYSLPVTKNTTDGLSIDANTGILTWTHLDNSNQTVAGPSGTMLNTLEPTEAVTVRATNAAGTYTDQTFTVNVYIKDPTLDMTGDPTANGFSVRLNGTKYEIVDLGANQVILRQPVSVSNSFTVVGSNTEFLVDFAAGGSFALPGGLKFQSGGSNNLMVIKGASSNTIVGTASSLTVDGMPISLTSISTVQITGGAKSNAYKLSGSLSSLQVTNPSGSSNTLDFSGTTGGTGVTLDLSKKSGQAQAIAAWSGKTLAITGDVQYVTGTPYNDTITGNGVYTVIHGGVGNDILHAGPGGTAIVYGDDGNDTLYADSAMAALYGGGGNNTLYGGTQKSVLIGGSGANTLVAGKGQSALVAGTPSQSMLNDQALLNLLSSFKTPSGLAYLARLSPVLAKIFGGKIGLKMGVNVTPSVGKTTVVSSGWQNIVVK
jgi:peptidyl-prolyl cis-trans isomerase A (cyclophilin A)